jgi:hypothetical protein
MIEEEKKSYRSRTTDVPVATTMIQCRRGGRMRQGSCRRSGRSPSLHGRRLTLLHRGKLHRLLPNRKGSRLSLRRLSQMPRRVLLALAASVGRLDLF